MAVGCFWAVVVGFMAGVFVTSLMPLGYAASSALALIAVMVFLTTRRDSWKYSIPLAVALAACALGIARIHLADIKPDPVLHRQLGQKITIAGVVAAEPDVRENNIRIRVRTQTSDTAPTVEVLAIIPLHSNIAYGDPVEMEGTLRLPKTFETETGRKFNYPAFLKKEGILYELSFSNTRVIGENQGDWFVRGVLLVKQKYLEGLARALPEPSAGLASGITVGDKRALGSELSDSFRTVALIHIVVLSGYNIMVVINWLAKIFSWTSQRVRFGIGAFTAIVFVVMTGGAAPSVRAAAMAMIGMAGRMSKRTYLAMRALAFVAAGMVVWNPFTLPSDPGFQLSVAATWGIIALSPITERWFSRLERWPSLREISATTTATQIAVLPLLLYQSGTFSLYALPANLLVLAALPAAMFFSFVASLGGLTLGPIAPIVALPAHALLSYFVAVADFFAHLPLASISPGAISIAWVLAAYALLSWYVARDTNCAHKREWPRENRGTT